MRISILLPEIFSNIDYILSKLNTILIDLNCDAELIVGRNLKSNTEDLKDALGINNNRIHPVIIDTEGCKTFGETFTKLFKNGTGTFFICLRLNTAYDLLFFKNFYDEHENNLNTLGYVLKLKQSSSKASADSFDFDHRKLTQNSFACCENLIIWKRVAYFLVGGFNGNLHLSADIDFERRLQAFCKRVSIIDVTNSSQVPDFELALDNQRASSFLKSQLSPFLYLKPPETFKNTFFFCLSHKAPLYQLPWFVNCINVSADRLIGGYQASEFFTNFATLEELLLGEIGIFVVYQILSNIKIENSHEYFVSLCYFRKFYSITTFGPLVSTGDPVYTVLGHDVDFSTIANEIAGRLVKPNIIEYDDESVLEAYSQSHHLDDYLFATQVAVKIGVLDSAETDNFLKTHRFIHWAHAGCTLPLPLFLEITDKLLRLLNAIVASGYRSPFRYIPYQRRWLAFYFERLSSYLLLKHYPDLQAPEGKLHNVNLPEEGLGVFNPGGLYSVSRHTPHK